MAKIPELKTLLEQEFIGEAGGIPGLVRITIDAAGHAKKVEIDDLVFNETDKQLISDLFVAALNDAFNKADAAIREASLEYYRKVLANGGHSDPYGSPTQSQYNFGKDGFDITKLLKGDPDDGKSGNN